MNAPSQKRPNAYRKLDPEHPDFLKDCMDMAARLVGCGGRDPDFKDSAIRILAASIAYLAHTEEQVSLFDCAPGLPCSFGGDAAGPQKRRRNPKGKLGGRIP